MKLYHLHQFPSPSPAYNLKKLKMSLALANHPFEFRETTFEW